MNYMRSDVNLHAVFIEVFKNHFLLLHAQFIAPGYVIMAYAL